MTHFEKFQALAKKHGFKLVKVSAIVNGVVTRRKDILSVRFHGHHIMTAPRKMYGYPVPGYRDLLGNELQHYYDREYCLKNWAVLLKRSGHLIQLEANKAIDAKLWRKAL